MLAMPIQLTTSFRRATLTVLSAALALLALAALAPTADAAGPRRPVASFVDANGLHLFDLQKKREIKQPPVPVEKPATFRYGMSLDGRFVVYTDGKKNLHLLDRFNGQERPLPGIDTSNNPGNLTASDAGLIAFDDNGNGPTQVYDSKARQFVTTGFAAKNKQRQPKLSGDGHYLATTCLDGAKCVKELSAASSDPFVQNLVNRMDTGFNGAVAMRDSEHPCINDDGSLIALDRQNPNANSPRDVFLYERTTAKLLPLPMDPNVPETFCKMDATGNYVGWLFDNKDIKVFDRARNKFLGLPPGLDTMSALVSSVDVSKFRVKPKRPKSGESMILSFTLTTKANVRITISRSNGHGSYKKVGSVARKDRLNGRVAILWNGHLHGRSLKKGSYKATLNASGGQRDEKSKSLTTHFSVR
jgi:hypothetical protein